MALPQLTYPAEFTKAIEGGLADGSFDSFILSASNVAAPSEFGRAALLVATDGEQFVQPTGTAGVFLGILVHTHAVAQSQVTAGGPGLPVNHPGGILRRGRIWVIAEDVVASVADTVFYRHTTPAGPPEALGRFRTDVDGTNATQVTAAKWVTTTSGVGELAILEINLP